MKTEYILIGVAVVLIVLVVVISTGESEYMRSATSAADAGLVLQDMKQYGTMNYTNYLKSAQIYLTPWQFGRITAQMPSGLTKGYVAQIMNLN